MRLVVYLFSMRSIQQRVMGRLQRLMPRPIRHFKRFVPYVQGKAGLEIGGPSEAFRPKKPLPLYAQVGTLDNCDFSSDTVWANHSKDFTFSPGKPPGKTIVCDGSQLDPVAADSYDFILSSHNLEHFANPVKALLEWKRVLRPGGALILILPYYKHTFDHRRTPTPVENMMCDWQQNVGEDDLSHLDEILQNHDLVLDPGSSTAEGFRARSLDNFNNRCLHHHVFDEYNSRALLTEIGFTVHEVDLARPFHLCLLATI
jgi:SAM-dependent methyltransferase